MGKLFRRRLRIPSPLFEQLVSQFNEVNLFEIVQEAKVRIPIEFKLLICLRFLGRGNVHDDIAEMADSFETSVHYFLFLYLILISYSHICTG